MRISDWSSDVCSADLDCLGANRFYVQRPVYDEFCRRFAGKAAALTVGRGIDDPDIGPLMNAQAVAKQQEHVADALAQGARLLCGGERPEERRAGNECVSTCRSRW